MCPCGYSFYHRMSCPARAEVIMQTKKRFHHLMLLVPPAEARRWHAVARREDLRLSQFIRRLVRERVAQITEPGVAAEPARRQGVTLSTLVRQAVGERPAGT